MLRMESPKCRLCLGTLVGSRRCLWEGSFRSAIEQVFWFQIKPSEGLSSYACGQCCSFVRKFHKYGLKVQKNQTEFRKECTDTQLPSVDHSGGYESTSELEESLRLSSSDDEYQDKPGSFSCNNQTTASDTLKAECQRHELHEENNRNTLQDSSGSNESESSLADNERLDKTYRQEDESDLNPSEAVSVEESAPKRKYFTRSVRQARRAKQSKQSEPATDAIANVEEKCTPAGGTETWHSDLLLAHAVASACDNSSEMEVSVQEDKDLVHTVKNEAPTDIVEGVEDRKELSNLVNVKLESDDLVSGAVVGSDTTANSDRTERALNATVPLPAGNHHSAQTSRRNNEMQTKARCKAISGTDQNESVGKRFKPKAKTKKKKREKICTSFADIWREFSKYCIDTDRCKKSTSMSQRDSKKATSKKSLGKSKATAVRTDNSNEGSQDSECNFNKLIPNDAIKEPIDVKSYNARDALDGSDTARHLRYSSKHHQSKQSVAKTKATQRSENSSSFRDILREFAFPDANTADDRADQAFITNTADNDAENCSMRCGNISSELLPSVDDKSSTRLDKL